MLHSSALIGFVGVADLGRARDFYGGLLELDLTDESPHALVVDIGGSMLRITAVGTPVIAPYTVLGWRVSDIDATVDHLVARGVVFSRYEGLEQDARGIWAAPGGDRVAWLLDPDGNNLSLTQFADPGSVPGATGPAGGSE